MAWYAASYLALCVVSSWIPLVTPRAFTDVLWLLGPPITLVHGPGYLWVFLTGTCVVTALVAMAVRAESVLGRIAWGTLGVLAWTSCGVMVYAPSI